jgi:D-alanyl-D-alanine carboxypeptidase
MRQVISSLTVACFVIAFFLNPGVLFAEIVFDPNNIISDEELQNWQSMNREDIQAFLNEQSGILDTLKSPDVDGTNRLSADIIARASQTHRINPKYILVKLQKEQSLISDTSPTQKQIDWATGYGVCDSCKTTDPSIQKHKGFGVQVDSAAGIMRWYYDHLNTESWIKRANQSYLIDGQLVRPQSNATGFLYSYTPHIHGNKNFWTLWNRWFAPSYPDGTLVKAGNNSTIYLLDGKTKRPFENMTSLITRYDPKLIVDIPSGELNKYDLGASISLPNFSVIKQGSTYYLVDYDHVRPFKDQTVVNQLGYHPDEIIEVGSEEIANYQQGTTIDSPTINPIGRLVRLEENNTLYFLKENEYHPILDEAIASVNFAQFAIEPVVASDLSAHVAGKSVLLKDGTLFGITGQNAIYVVEKGKKRHIASEAVYNGLGYDWDNIVWISSFAADIHTTGQPVFYTPNTSSNSVPAVLVLEESGSINERMQETKAEDTTYVGKQFDTTLDTYLIADGVSGDVIAGKNIDVIRPLASFAKVLTTYELFSQGINLGRTVTYDPSVHKSTYHSYRIAEGEKVRNRDLFDAFLLSSLNTPGHMLVSSKYTVETEFIELLNKRLTVWGLRNTVFADVTGEKLDTKSTARDYVTLFKKATDITDIRSILGKASYQYDEVLDTDGKPGHYDVHSNQLMEERHPSYKILASKTGYLDEAGHGLVMLIERTSDKKRFFIVIMGNPDSNPNTRFDAPRALTDWILSEF